MLTTTDGLSPFWPAECPWQPCISGMASNLQGAFASCQICLAKLALRVDRAIFDNSDTDGNTSNVMFLEKG